MNTGDTGTVGASLTQRLEQMAAERRPNDSAFATFVRGYLDDLPEFDLDDRYDDDLYAAIAHHFNLGANRQSGDIVVDVRTPTAARDGWDAARTLVFVTCDDMPFLVDTIRIVIERHRINTHLLIYPMIAVRRIDGELVDVEIGSSGSDGNVEAWTLVEVDRLTPEAAAALADDLRAAIALCTRIVHDFEPMRERMRAAADIDPLLGWLADDHFVLLGAATYVRSDGGDVAVADSALGILRDDATPDPEIVADGPTVSFARSADESPIHRPVRMTVITVRVAPDRFDRFVGLLSSAAYRRSVLGIPTVGDRAREVLGLAQHGAETHAGRSMRNVLETLPRDLVFELDAHRLAELVIDVVGLQERQIVRIFEVPEPVGTASTILVYLPKSRFTAQLPERIADEVAAAYESGYEDVDYFAGSSSLARITFTLVDARNATPDLDQLSERIDLLTVNWVDRIAAARERRNGNSTVSSARVAQVAVVAPAEFRTAVPVNVAAVDLERIAQLVSGDENTITALAREVDAPSDEWRVRVYRSGRPLSLSQLLPILTHLGFDTLEEHPYEFTVDGDPYFLLDIGVRVPAHVTLDDRVQDELLVALDELLDGSVEPDGFNQLVLAAGLDTRQIDVIRAYARYAQQTNFAFSQAYVEETLARLPTLARLISAHFEAKFDPDRADGDARHEATQAARQALADALDEVQSLDDDRIVRTFMHLVDATIRTSAFQIDKPTIAFKFDPSLTPNLPDPRPAYEIFVSSIKVEGVHLRGGPIARGGIRWSDRFEDYRTEVLGLVKAQMVKNAVIVPVGAKGGFIVKGLMPDASRDDRQAAGVAAYRLYISALLDITDNIVDGEVVHPERCVRYDGDDPYLVVAADKGTASFSDIANKVAASYDFWLDDAFASGGSAGYDHKGMGITARGAWESVRRHCQILGIDPEFDEISVVGIGDMSGDVFGNGMLRSRTIKLVAAFDHRDIFIDPDPDPAASFDERLRLFELPRSSWQDYDVELISDGGGVFSRSLKEIELTDEMRDALGIPNDIATLTPSELISSILTAPVDLLWNGGIGTYVKGTLESNADCGDRANDALRVNGADLRCRMVGEGGNLGVTQLGRIEYALDGGLIYTDAIDNSAGVDTSDHEVNIKILLRQVMQNGELTLKQRNELLEEMTDEVAELVLDDNRAQTLALMIARQQGLPMVNVHARYLDVLENEGHIDRALEFLPNDKQIAERQSAGSGLRAPELAVLIAYTKNVNVVEIMGTDLPDSPVLHEDLIDYFPTPLRERFRDEIMHHRLHREIAVTELVNQMTNLSGISFDHRMTEDTGSSVADVARAWLTVREILDFPAWWAEIGAIEGMRLDHQLDLFLDCRRTAERCSMWFMRHRRPPIDIEREATRFRQPMQQIQDGLADVLRGTMAASTMDIEVARIRQQVPDELARRSSVWRLLHTSFDIIEIADANDVAPLDAAAIYWEIFAMMELGWLWDGVGALPRSDRWQTQARASLRDDLLTALAGLARSVLEHPDGTLDGWLASNAKSYERAMEMLTQIRRADAFNLTNLSVALRQLRNLSATAVR